MTDPKFARYLLKLSGVFGRALRQKSRTAGRVMKHIDEQYQRTDVTRGLEGIQDHLALLRVGLIFVRASCVTTIDFEENCGANGCSKSHDIVVETNNALKIINEVRRLTPDKLGGRSLEEQYTTRVSTLEELKSVEPEFREVRLFTDTTSPLRELIELTKSKEHQFCSGVPGILWFVSRNFLFDGIDVEDAYVELGRTRQFRPQGLGWLHDVTVTSDSPSIIFEESAQFKNLVKECNITARMVGLN